MNGKIFLQDLFLRFTIYTLVGAVGAFFCIGVTNVYIDM